jgi:hypothetical protein
MIYKKNKEKLIIWNKYIQISMNKLKTVYKIMFNYNIKIKKVLNKPNINLIY